MELEIYNLNAGTRYAPLYFVLFQRMIAM